MSDLKERFIVSKQKMISLLEELIEQNSRLRDLTEAVSRKFEEERKVADARVIDKTRYLLTQLVERRVEIEKAKEKFKQLEGEFLEAKAKVLELESKLVDEESKLMLKDEDLGETTLKLIQAECEIFEAKLRLAKKFPIIMIDDDGAVDPRKDLGTMNVEKFQQACRLNGETETEAEVLMEMWLHLLGIYRKGLVEPVTHLRELKTNYGYEIHNYVVEVFHETKCAVLIGLSRRPWDELEDRPLSLAETVLQVCTPPVIVDNH